MTSSLEMMYNMGLKNQAAYGLPQQMQSEQAMAAAKLREQQMANDQSAVMNPLNAQFKQGEINQQQAQLPGLQGQAQSLAAQGQYDTQTLPNKIADGISKYASQMGENDLKKLARSGEIALKVSQMLKNYPPALHKEVAQKAFQAYGGDPGMLQGLLQMPDAAVAKGLDAMGKGMSMASSEFLQKQSLNNDDNRSREGIARGNNATQIQVANINAEAKKQVAAERSRAVKNMTSDQAFTYLSGIPESELTDDQREHMRKISAERLAERAAGANGVAANVMNQATPQQTAQATASQITNPNGGKPAASGGGDVAEIKAAGLEYDPANYEYKKINGAWKRRPKQ